MSDLTLLLTGIFCFALTLLGLVLTVLEFRKFPAAIPRKPTERGWAMRVRS